MLGAIILATLLISLLSFVGLLFISPKKHRVLEIGISLAVGALLGTVFLGLIPEIVENLQDKEQIDFYGLVILLSILAFFLIERFFHWHHCHCEDEHCHQCVKPMGWINIFGDGVHNLVDGMVIGASFLVSWQLGLITSLAIALHEIPQEVGDFSILLKAGFSKAQALWWNLVSGLLAVLGGIVVYFFAAAQDYSLFFLSLAAGSFLYLAMSDIIPQLHHSDREEHNWQLLGIILGLGLIYFGQILLPHVH